MLESELAIGELADGERIAPSYMTSAQRLALLVPNLAEAGLDGRQGPKRTPSWVSEPFPVERVTQRRRVD